MAKPGPPPGTPKVPGSGRKKGSGNKITGCMKQEAWNVFYELQKNLDSQGNPLPPGQETSLLDVARRDPRFFYSVFGQRLVPKIIEGSGEENPLLVRIVNAAQRKAD